MTPAPASSKPLPIYKSFAASAIAACTAEALTIPLDTAKVRLQLQGKVEGVPKYKGLLGTVGTVAREEGLTALWAGLEPGLHRQCLFGGLRIGLYDPVKAFYAKTLGIDTSLDVPFALKVASGLTTGALGIAIASPTDLVKVRMQTEGKRPPGAPKKYPNAVRAYGIIIKEEGVAGLWRGIGPNVARNAIVNAAELATYDQVKASLLATGAFDEGIPLHITSGLGAGFFAVVCGSPVDVVKSRMMGDITNKYSGVLNCFVKTFRAEGLPAFYSGFIPNFARLGSWNAAMFVTAEYVKKLMRGDD